MASNYMEEKAKRLRGVAVGRSYMLTEIGGCKAKISEGRRRVWFPDLQNQRR